MQNTTTTSLALLMVPPATVFAFSRMRPARAILTLMLGSTLFLPELARLEVPGLPVLDKQSLPLLCMAIGVLVTGRKEVLAARPGRGIDLCILGMLAGCVGTVLTNADPLRYGPTLVPGLGQSDLISDWIAMLLQVALPFLLGRLFFRTADDALLLLGGFVIGALIYTPLVLVELRISPQWHNWIYGFQQQSWAEAKRGGGWRPVVFMRHGLALALFMSVSAFAAWALTKRRRRVVPLPPALVAVTFSVLLAMMHSLGALIYGVVGVPVAWFTKPKTQLRFAAVIALLIATYPTLRITEWFPAQQLVDYTAQQSQERAGSLAVRFTNEDAFLQRALLRPFFGWGGWARGHIWNQQGKDITILDGGWLAMLQRGFVELGLDGCLLLLPVFMALARVDRVPKADQPLLSGAALVSVFYTLDLLPNGIFNRLPMFCAGALAGLSQGMSSGAVSGGGANPLIRALVAQIWARQSARAPALSGGRS